MIITDGCVSRSSLRESLFHCCIDANVTHHLNEFFVCVCYIAELSLFRGEVTSGGAIVSPVQGLVALGLGGGGGTPTRQYLDCNGTSNAVGNLQWNRDSGVISLTISARMRELRLDLSSADDQDEGIYTCMDTVTGDTVSINVTGGEKKPIVIR